MKIFGKSKLADLIKAGKLEKVKRSVHPSPCNSIDAEGQMPLRTAFYGNGLASMLEEILAEDKKIDSVFTDLVIAPDMPFREKIQLLEQLLKKGADINAEMTCAGFQINVLTAVTCWDDGIDKPKELLEWLLERGAKIECHGRSAFLWAIGDNKSEWVRFYAQKGGDLLYKEADGATMLSKVFTRSPSGDQYESPQERGNMLRLLSELCTQQNEPFPLEKPFVNGHDADNLFSIDTLPQMAVYYTGDARQEIVKALMAAGWDINRKFQCADSNGSLISQFLSCKEADPEIVAYLLDNYPEMDLGNAGTSDLLYRAIGHGYAPEIIQKFIRAAKDVNKTIVRKFDNGFIKKREESYVGYTLDRASLMGDRAENWAYGVCRALLDAGLDPNTIEKRTLGEQYMLGGYYRKEHTLLEETLNFENIRYFNVFKLLLDYGADPFQRTGYCKETFLHFLMQRAVSIISQEEKIEYLDELDKRGMLRLECKTNNGATALLYAVSKCRVKLVRYFINKGANVHVVGGFDQSYALHRAISNFASPSKDDRLETVRILLDAGANKEQIDNDGFSPLMAAAAFGCYTVAEELLKRGADPNLLNDEGKAAVHFAVTEPNCYDEYPADEDNEVENGMDESLKLRIIKLLVAYGADLNIAHGKGTTPLMDAISYGYQKIFKGLIKLGADIHTTDSYGRTPFMVAAKYGNIVFFNILGMGSDLGKNIWLKDDNGDNILHYLAGRMYKEQDGFALPNDKVVLPIVKMLMEQYKVPYERNKYGQTPLHIAAMTGMPELIMYFIKQNNVNELDNNNNTALIYAVTADNEAIGSKTLIKTVTTLVKNGANVNLRNGERKTALTIAEERQMKDITNILESACAKQAPRNIRFIKKH